MYPYTTISWTIIDSIGIEYIDENSLNEEDEEISVGESDVSDFENEDFGNDEGISNWLDEEDEIVESLQSSAAPTPSIEIPECAYIRENKSVYLALLEVEDLNFNDIPVSKQEEVNCIHQSIFFIEV